MSLKFRKRIRVFPGFTLNLSKTGMSATLGVRGCSVNFGRNGTYLNTGIPGTGIYDRIRLDNPNNTNDNGNNPQIPVETPYNTCTVETEIKSYNPELITSDSMSSLKQSMWDAEKVKKVMYQEWMDGKS